MVKVLIVKCLMQKIGNFIYKFSDFKIAKTLILLEDASENAILLFKNSLNKYIFDNFIELQYKRNVKGINEA